MSKLTRTINARHITLPAGFLAAGVKCGIKASGKNDLAIIAGDDDLACAVVTTTNQVFGEPVRYIRQVMPKGFGMVRGFVINAGCSNVCTGKDGFKDTKEMATLTAKALSAKGKPPVGPEKVLVASTGIIGHRLPMPKVKAGIAAAARQLGTDNDADALRAIMTTDTREKFAVEKIKLSGKTVTVAGMVKGSGMIAPSLATMIGAITTDAAITPAILHEALQAAIAPTFNAITVDSDTSTSDTVAVLASGQAGNAIISGTQTPDYETFATALRKVCCHLAKAVVADGEGATKVIQITVTGAQGDGDARTAAKSVANSPLFKCAVHGGDPNWGRIACALGKSSAKVDPAKLIIKIGGATIFAKGTGKKFDLKKVQKHLKGNEIKIDCDLGLGKGQYTAVTCDLSREYIAINADYHT